MPTETIRDPNGPIGTSDQFVEMAVQVKWGREADVVLGTIDLSGEGSGLRENGMWMNLDRGGINRLIKTLRRARDQAFGVDE